MTGLIICTHGRFSEELVRSSEMMFGKQHNLQFVTFEPGESVEGLMEKYGEAITRLEDKSQILFLVDLFGGSPYNAASRIVANHENMDVVAGVNLPMLLEMYIARNTQNIADLAKTAIAAGSSSIKSFRANFTNNIEEEL